VLGFKNDVLELRNDVLELRNDVLELRNDVLEVISVNVLCSCFSNILKYICSSFCRYANLFVKFYLICSACFGLPRGPAAPRPRGPAAPRPRGSAAPRPQRVKTPSGLKRTGGLKRPAG